MRKSPQAHTRRKQNRMGKKKLTPKEMTEAVNRVIEKLGSDLDPVIMEHSRRMLRKVEW